ncbi:AIR synthase-related protein [Escherichia coli]
MTEGGRYACRQAGIALAGGHSIDARADFWSGGNGDRTDRAGEENSTAQAGCKLFLTKPLGIGVLTTAEKKSLLKPEASGTGDGSDVPDEHRRRGIRQIDGVKAMTDVTGFGLLGHLS